ncbi:MAG: ABC transporter substrate-binding protein [Chloroflexi bacterium]|nr:ABC transporter substrate-binding protein [Chloroflexota bacterium]
MLNDISGPGSIEGAEQKINTDLAIAQINASGGVNGHPLVGDFVDSKGDAATAVQLANQLANQDKVDVLVGGVYSAECLGVEQQVNNYGIAYLPLNACANEQLTSQTCNKLVFRVFPVGGQTLKPPLGYVVKTYGAKWAIITTQNPFGDSQIAATDAAMKDINGQVTVKIQVPVGEANVTPYVTKIPTDGSVNGVLNYENGTDLARVVQVMAQFGVNKLPQLMFLGAESFGGVYPDSVNGAILGRLTLNNPPAGPAADYLKAFKDQVGKEGQVANVLGGNKAIPGDLGYESYATMMALKEAMKTANFTGRADTDKLVTALEGINVPQATPDFPYGGMIMNKADHQGATGMFMVKVNGQDEQVLQSIPANQIPPIGSCQVK